MNNFTQELHLTNMGVLLGRRRCLFATCYNSAGLMISFILAVSQHQD